MNNRGEWEGEEFSQGFREGEDERNFPNPVCLMLMEIGGISSGDEAV